MRLYNMEEKEIEPIETLQAKLDEESKTITIDTVRPSIIIRANASAVP
jgi:hypothetical protein